MPNSHRRAKAPGQPGLRVSHQHTIITAVEAGAAPEHTSSLRHHGPASSAGAATRTRPGPAAGRAAAPLGAPRVPPGSSRPRHTGPPASHAIEHTLEQRAVRYRVYKRRAGFPSLALSFSLSPFLFSPSCSFFFSFSFLLPFFSTGQKKVKRLHMTISQYT